jgi:hypothetical protein
MRTGRVPFAVGDRYVACLIWEELRIDSSHSLQHHKPCKTDSHLSSKCIRALLRWRRLHVCVRVKATVGRKLYNSLDHTINGCLKDLRLHPDVPRNPSKTWGHVLVNFLVGLLLGSSRK